MTAAVRHDPVPSLLPPDAGYTVYTDELGYAWRCAGCFQPCGVRGFTSHTDAVASAEGHQQRRHPAPPPAVPVVASAPSTRTRRWGRRR